MNRDKSSRGVRVGIRWKFFIYMMAFLLLLLGLLWLFQVVFFGEIYKSVRISEIIQTADKICESIDDDNLVITSVTKKHALEKQVCVIVFDESGKIIATEKQRSDCIIHEMSARSIYTLYAFAKESGGEKLSRFHIDAFRNISYDPEVYNKNKSDSADSMDESIIFTRVVYSESRGSDVIVMLNTTISPVASTVRTLQHELLLISIIMTLIALIISFVMARRVSKPLVDINEGAKKLADGKYDFRFKSEGYREIAELAQTLNYASEELSKAGALQRELIANISHDLRTPLTMITGYAEIMRDIPDENTPENVQIIVDEAKRLTSLVNDVLDISKLQAGTQTLEVSEFNLTETVNEVIERFSKLTESDGWTIEFYHDANVMVNADRTRILQVIYNFINNAITHSGEDKTVIVTQRVITDQEQSHVRIEVTDHGEGISSEDIPYIWDRYYKVDKLHRRAQMGSGLGLSIVKSILDLHGARYGVSSTQGVGSTFWFEL